MAYKFNIPQDFDPAAIPQAKGVTVGGGIVEFSDEWTEGRALSYLKASIAATEGKHECCFQTRSKAFEPTEEDRGILRRMGIDEDVIAEFKFRELQTAHDQLDRDEEVFTKAYLSKFVELINTEPKSIILDHNMRGPTLAVAFRGKMEEAEGKTWFTQKIYIDPTVKIPGTEQTVYRGIQTKYLNHVSIGFMGRAKMVERPDGTWYGVFDIEEGGVQPEITETSFVKIPAQPGARVKSFEPVKATEKPTPPKTQIEKLMEVKFLGKSFQVTAKDESVDGLKALEDFANTKIKEATDRAAAAEAQVDALKKGYVDDIKRLQGKEALNLTGTAAWDEEDFAHKSLAKLAARAQELADQYAVANPEGQTKGGGTPEGKRAGSITDAKAKMSHF